MVDRSLRVTETGEENGTPRRNEYDVDEDDGGRDNHELEAPRRSTTFVTRLAQLEEGEWEVVKKRHDEHDCQ